MVIQTIEEAELYYGICAGNIVELVDGALGVVISLTLEGKVRVLNFGDGVVSDMTMDDVVRSWNNLASWLEFRDGLFEWMTI